MTEAASKIGLSAENIKTLFGDVGGLASLNLKLLQDLAKKILAWSDTQTIGDVLKMMVHTPPFFFPLTDQLRRDTKWLDRF